MAVRRCPIPLCLGHNFHHLRTFAFNGGDRDEEGTLGLSARDKAEELLSGAGLAEETKTSVLERAPWRASRMERKPERMSREMRVCERKSWVFYMKIPAIEATLFDLGNSIYTNTCNFPLQILGFSPNLERKSQLLQILGFYAQT
ncbi:hypothetical protein C1H46_007792 [Malus baccata]|uniref:Uncharacterized protein n=1 Tax=Malus baccata TaxID=106549 RepID=A0A540N7T5_MALBA|nr:hypothetical protein C1H46_007792 [Malus baccata]